MTGRRAFLQWLGAAPVATITPKLALAATVASGGARPLALTGFDAGEQLVIAELKPVAAGAALLGAEAAGAPPPTTPRTLERFALTSAVPSSGSTPFGAGQRLTLTGKAEGAAVEKTVKVTLLDEHPGVALIEVAFINRSDKPLMVQGWTVASHRLLAAPRHAGGWWSYSGSTHTDRRDWMQPVKRGFEQRNFLGMDSSDYGGGTPLVDVWRRDLGVALGNVDKLPRLGSRPVKGVG